MVQQFVGRSADLLTVEARLDLARSGRGGLILVSGEAGIGKTTFAAQCAARAGDLGFQVAWGRCWEDGGAPSFWPWSQVVSVLDLFIGESSSWPTKIPEFADWLDPFSGHAAAALLSPMPDRFAAFAKFASSLCHLSCRNPLLIVLDDIHCCDDASLALLRFLAVELETNRIAIIATYREGQAETNRALSSLVGVMSRYDYTYYIRLTGLSAADISELLNNCGIDVDTTVVTALLTRTGGNPFFIREVLRMHARSNNDSSGAAILLHALPRSIVEVVRVHLETTSVECQTLIRVASAIGLECDCDLLSHITMFDGVRLSAAACEAQQAGLVSFNDDNRLTFRHAVVRDAVYDGIDLQTKKSLHLAIARVIESRIGDDRRAIRLLAHHYSLSLPTGSSEKALEFAIRAGREACSQLAYEEGISYYDSALRLGLGRLSSHRRCEIMLALGECQLRSGYWAESRRTFQFAANEARENGNACQFARAALGFKGSIGGTLPPDFPAIALLREAVALVEPNEIDLQIKLLSALAYALYFADCAPEMEILSSKALSLVGKVCDGNLERIALLAKLYTIWMPTRTAEILSAATSLLRSACDAGDRDMQFRAHVFRYGAFLERGMGVPAAEEMECVIQLSQELREARYLWQATAIRSNAAFICGNLPLSRQLAESARMLGDAVHDSSSNHCFLVQSLQIDAITGEFGKWDEILSKFVERYPSVPAYRAARAYVLSAEGEIDKALSDLAALSAHSFSDLATNSLFLWTVGLIAEAAVNCGDLECCKSVHHIMEPFADHNIVAVWGMGFSGPVAAKLALLSARCGAVNSANAYFRKAVKAYQAVGATLMNGIFQLRYATAVRQWGIKDEGFPVRSVLMDSLGIFRAVRNAPLITKAENEISELGSPSKSAMMTACFKVEGRECIIEYDGVRSMVRTTLGIKYISVLIGMQGRDVHVLDLVRGAVLDSSQEGTPGVAGASVAPMGVGAVPDGRACQSYRVRLLELESDLTEAVGDNDLGRIEALKSEILMLKKELSDAYRISSKKDISIERARVAVRNRISSAIQGIHGVNGSLANHLRVSIRTGTVCSYVPERVMDWRL
jgi:tetratricopeptide (TPR) repeat protein